MTMIRTRGMWRVAKPECTAKGGEAGVTHCSWAHGSLETMHVGNGDESFVETEHTLPEARKCHGMGIRPEEAWRPASGLAASLRCTLEAGGVCG